MRAIGFIWLMVLAGCTALPSTTPAPVALSAPEYHPPWPSPVNQPPTGRWTVVTLNENGKQQAYVALTHDESLDHRLFIEDLLRFIRQQKAMLCYYRRELKEAQCLGGVQHESSD